MMSQRNSVARGSRPISRSFSCQMCHAVAEKPVEEIPLTPSSVVDLDESLLDLELCRCLAASRGFRSDCGLL